MSESRLLEKIRQRNAKLAIVGLGHIGLPTALVFAHAGFDVEGIDTDTQRVDTLGKGICPIREPGLQDLLTSTLANGTFHVTTSAASKIGSSDFTSICVPTPVQSGIPNLDCLKTAIRDIRESLHREMAVLIHSTVPPTTTYKFVVPELQKSGYEIDNEIFVAYCPERLTPSRALKELADNPRIVGGVGPRSSRVTAQLFKTVCNDVRVTDPTTAELTKLAENTFRDLNIAYANLLALISERQQVDFNEVVALANTHPRVGIHSAGAGVGGPCLPKDPYMLVQGLPENLAELVKLGRKLNDHMSRRIPKVVKDLLVAKSIAIDGAKVAVLGVAYKADVDDTANSPAEPVIRGFLEMGAHVIVYDPFSAQTFMADRADDLAQAVRDADAVIIVTAHSEFKALEPQMLGELAKSHCIVFDGPRVLDPTRVREARLTYIGTGYGKMN